MKVITATVSLTKSTVREFRIYNSKILVKESRTYPRKILESELIKLKNFDKGHLLNLNGGWSLSNLWQTKPNFKLK